MVFKQAAMCRGGDAGAGGAVVWQSDSAAEYEEMRVKARAVVGAVGAAFGEGGVVRVDDGKG